MTNWQIFVMLIQTCILGAFGCYLMRERTAAEVITVYIVTQGVVAWAQARGIPFWGDHFGDAYDLGVIFFLTLSVILSRNY